MPVCLKQYFLENLIFAQTQFFLMFFIEENSDNEG